MAGMECEDWPIRWPCDITSEDEALLDLVRISAQQMLWSMSGRRYGLCETTESYNLPCSSPCSVPYAGDFGPGVDYLLNDQARVCCQIHLTSLPVRAIVEVVELGETLDPDDYALNRDVLMRRGRCWPCEDECEDPPVQVTYLYGIDIPALGELAMGELACELLAGITGADCRLPSNAISITRQGVTVDLGDASTLTAENRLGLPLCDLFLRSTNPHKLHSRSQVWSPDLARRRR
jgi:hypothetical protein